MRKLILLIYIIVFGVATKAQVVEVSANAGTSANPALGTSNYVANESIYTETELGGPTNFTSAGSAMNRIALNVTTVGAPTTFNNVKVYFKDVPAATTTFNSGTYTTAGYTLVFNGSVTLAATGWTEFVLTTPYVRAAGTNLQVLIERTDNVAHAGYVWTCANGNNNGSTLNTTRRYNSTTALSAATSLTISAFRQAMRFIRRVPNDAVVKQVYTLGKIPLPNGVPHVISANISNDGLNALTNINVTLNITGANTFSNTQTIASLAAGASTTVSFPAFSPTIEGINNINVSVPADDANSNNSLTVSQTVNKNTWSYAYGSTSSGGVGFTGATGDFVAKFSTSAATSLSQVSVNFSTAGQTYRIGVWDASGAGGTPGTLLWESADQVAALGANVLPVSPILPISIGDFFVGVRQIGTTNVGFASQTENPIRTSTFYFTSPSGGTTWTDFAPNSPFRLMIEPKLILPRDANVSNLVVPNRVSCHGPSNTVTALLTNAGSNSMAAGAATLTLRVRGANTFDATATNATTLASGASEVITFTGVNMANPGTNFDTVFVNLIADGDRTNDTARASNTTARTITTLPMTESYENATFDVGNISVLAGARNLVTLQTGAYTNLDLGGSLSPQGGNRMILFDNYGGASSAGVLNRLYSECIAVPASGAGLCSYKLSFWMSHDTSFTASRDSLFLAISNDKGLTWNRVGFYGRYDAGFTVPGWRKETINLAPYAGQTIQIGFENLSKYGNIIAIDNILVGGDGAQQLVLSTNANNGIALQKTCDDQGWTYYADPADATKSLIAIQWDPSNTGTNAAAKAQAIPKLQLDATFFAAEDIPNKKATYTMRRYWDVNLNGSTLTGPVNLRFFYDSTEKKAIDNAAATFATTNAGTLETGIWFKTVSGAFVPNATNVTPDGVQNAIPLTNVNTTNATIGNALYAQFNGLTSFSGGTYATGVGPNTPIPVELVSFTAQRRGSVNELQWTTAQELNSRWFIVERSTDGSSYSAIGQVAANGNSSTLKNYAFTDNAPTKGINHYRLRMVDKDNGFQLSMVRKVRNEGLADVAIYPNPVTDKLTVEVQADRAINGQLVVTDVSGKLIYSRTINIAQGNNIVPVAAAAWQKGSYVVKLIMESDVVVRKFNKL